MRSLKIAAAALASVSLLAIPTLASAATSSDTTVSFEVTGGTIAISQASTTANLGSAAFSLEGTALTGALPTVTVSDNTNLVGTWSVNVSMASPFSDGASNTVAQDNAVAYVPGAITISDSLTMTGSTTAVDAATGVTLSAVGGTLLGGSTVLGGGTVTYTPSIQVTIPDGTPNGTYTGTVTQTVSTGA